MKKLFILAALFFSFSAVFSQKTTSGNYTYIAQRYEWIAGMFQGLGLPAGAGPADFKTGQERRAGAIYYDSVGIDSGTYVYSGLAWRLLGEYTSSNGVYQSGNDFRLGGPLGTPSVFTEQRVINLNGKSLYFIKNSASAPVLGTGGYSPIFGEFIDTVYASSLPSSVIPTAATSFNRIFRVTGNFASQFKVGHAQTLKYEFGTNAPVLSNGGDFGGAVYNTLSFGYLPSFTTGHLTITGGATAFESVFSALSNTEFSASSASRHMRYTGWLAGHNVNLRMTNFTDTIDNYIFYNMASFKEANAKVIKSYGLYVNGVPSDSAWSIYSPLNVHRLYHEGPVTIGSTTSSIYKFRVQGDSYFSDSVYLNTAREVTDTIGMDIVLRKQSDGSLLRIKPYLLGVGGGGGGSWGSITGTLSAQTDLQSALDAKESALTFSTGLTRTTNTITSNLSTGVTGGQSVIGGTASGNDLTLSSTSHGTKGNLFFGNSTYDEVNNRLGIGTTAPNSLMELVDNATSITLALRDAGISTPFTTLFPSGTIGRVGQYSNTLGGLALQGYSNAAGQLGFALQGHVGSASPTAPAVAIEGWKLTGTTRTAMTSTEKVLQVFSGATELVTVQGNGDVGIGTASPSAKLDVVGSTELNGVVSVSEQAAPSTPTSGYAAIYPKTDGYWYGKNDGGSEYKLSNSTLTKNATIELPTSSENIGMFRTPVAITITNTHAVLVGSSTPSVTYQISFGTDRTSATNVYTAGQTVTSTTTGTAASGVNDATIPADSWVWITTSAQSGTVNQISLSVTYTED